MDLDLRRIIWIARRWWWLLILVPVIAAAYAHHVGAQKTPLYSATVKLQVSPNTGLNPVDSGAIQTSESLATAYTQMILARPILAKVASDLRLPYGASALQGMTTVSTIADTFLLQITVTSSNPEVTASIANAIAQTFIDYTASQASQERSATQKALDNQVNDLRVQMSSTEQQINDLESQLQASVKGTPTAREEVTNANTQSQLVSLRTTLNDQQLALNQLLATANQVNLANASAQNRISIFEPAIVPLAPFTPGPFRETVLGGLAGLMMAIGAVAVLEFLDTTVNAGSDFMEVAGAPLLGTVDRLPRLRRGEDQVFVSSRPNLRAAEAIRLIRTNLAFSLTAKRGVLLVVTSAGSGEGKSTMTANIGAAFAQAGMSVIVVDADFRRPSQYRIFGLPQDRGVTTLLSKPEMPWREAAVHVKDHFLVIPSGSLPANPGDLLSQDILRQRLEEIRSNADVILVDTPPAQSMSDALTVAGRADGVILVCRAGHTRTEALSRTSSSLRQAGAHIVGIIVNKQSARKGRYYASARSSESWYQMPDVPIKIARKLPVPPTPPAQGDERRYDLDAG